MQDSGFTARSILPAHSTTEPGPSQRRPARRWLRYGISLGVTAIIALCYSSGWVPPKSIAYVCNTISLLSLFINVRYPTPVWPTWLTDDRQFILALINLAILVLCGTIGFVFFREIPADRIWALIESPLTPWYAWGLVGLGQLQTHWKATIQQ